jgi:hypothetical protein
MNQTPTEPLLLEVMHVEPEMRRALRRAVEVRCDVVSHYWDRAVTHTATDVTPFGLWVDTLFPLHTGAEVVVSFTPPGGDEVTVFGHVRRVVTGRLRKHRGPIGMGIEFSDIGYDEMVRVARCLTGIPPRRPADC